MTPTEATAIVTAFVAVLSSVVIPLYLRHAAARQKEEEVEIVSWEKMNSALQVQNTRLIREQEEVENRCRKRLQEAETDYAQRIATANTRINELEKTVADLYARLGRMQP